MEKLSNKEVKQLLKQHPHWHLANGALGVAIALFLSKLVVTPEVAETLEIVAFTITVVAVIYLFKMRRDVKKAHAAEVMKP